MTKKRFNQPDYVLIVGQGRSGTNWLLQLLDLSPITYCRNEANALATSPFTKLPSQLLCKPLGDNFGNQWDEAVAMTVKRMGERDRIGVHPKSYLSEPMRRLGGTLILNKSGVRRLLAPVIPQWSQPEWKIPRWYVQSSAFEQALNVLKLNQIPAWAQWVLQNRPQVLIVHIIRHPGGFLNSWRSRYLNTHNHDFVKQANQERLKKIASFDSQWAERFGNIETMTVEAAELWFWCYANEMIYQTGQRKSHYLPIIYENLVNSVLKTTQQLYQKCGLPWTEEIEKMIAQSASQSNEIAKAWSEKLSDEQVELVKQFLATSFMGQWWQ